MEIFVGGHVPGTDTVFDNDREAYETTEAFVDILGGGYVAGADAYARTYSNEGVYIEEGEDLPECAGDTGNAAGNVRSEGDIGTNPSAQINGNSYDINKLQKTQPYTYPENVSSIKEMIKQNGPNSVPPIEIRVHNGQALVVDGHHRLEAFCQLGYDRVPIKYLHSSQLGKTLPDGNYYRAIQELLDAVEISD